ncbi:hypothetical protein [Flavobacterium kingsejongi]|uniref:Uncharacterized protein n=1 Tax=Flavobacterium kingsejongi TaxID=1678728 RepID=A0A2S1LRS5_9FLAO|nr:hypothetical protein [Flavobacterium kingsejongi]AWG26388.1 hypothetical protein FK004_14700 [Flavobacterium kingsejongi]
MTIQKQHKLFHLFQKEIIAYFKSKNDQVRILNNQTIIMSGTDKGLIFTCMPDNSCDISYDEFSLSIDILSDFSIEAFISILTNHKLIQQEDFIPHRTELEMILR